MKLELFKIGKNNEVEVIGPKFEVNAIQIKDNFYIINKELELDQLTNFGSCTVGLGETTFLPFEDTGVQLS